MGKMTRPEVKKVEGGKFWEETYDNFYLKVYVPENDIEEHHVRKTETGYQ